jgi:hypothetical protein
VAKENAKPTRLIFGQKTLLSRTMHDIRYDELHDEFIVTNPYAQAILFFKGDANGEVAPLRYIQGPKTMLAGAVYSGLDRVEVDPLNDEVLVGVANSVLVFPRDANGDVAPKRVLTNVDSRFSAGQTTAVDNVHNLIIVGGSVRRGAQGGVDAGASSGAGGGRFNGALAIFNRTSSGDAKPLRLIAGEHTLITRINQMQVYAPKGWIVASQPGAANEQEPEGTFIGIWSINDNGDVPPRWIIGGPKSQLKKPRGVTINVKHKEIIAADMRLNSVYTFYFPEIF